MRFPFSIKASGGMLVFRVWWLEVIVFYSRARGIERLRKLRLWAEKKP